MMRRLIVGSLVAAALAVPGSAAAGGWATAGLGPPDDGISAGDTWRADVTIKQHGVTPLENVQPAVIIRSSDGKTVRFEAKPTDEPGVYRAEVKFPSAGTWTYAVDDGFSQTHQFPKIDVAAGGNGATAGEFFPLGPSLAGIALVVALAIALALLARRARRPQVVPA
jgi:hypothetical protein